MKLKLLKDQKWAFNMEMHEYKEGQVLISDIDIPEHIAGDMLKYGYAYEIEIKSMSPVVQNKMITPTLENKNSILKIKIQSMSKEELLRFAKTNNILVDKRWNIKNLLNQILEKIK